MFCLELSLEAASTPIQAAFQQGQIKHRWFSYLLSFRSPTGESSHYAAHSRWHAWLSPHSVACPGHSCPGYVASASRTSYLTSRIISSNIWSCLILWVAKPAFSGTHHASRSCTVQVSQSSSQCSLLTAHCSLLPNKHGPGLNAPRDPLTYVSQAYQCLSHRFFNHGAIPSAGKVPLMPIPTLNSQPLHELWKLIWAWAWLP